MAFELVDEHKEHEMLNITKIKVSMIESSYNSLLPNQIDEDQISEDNGTRKRN